jgi:hypothetical protein
VSAFADLFLLVRSFHAECDAAVYHRKFREMLKRLSDPKISGIVFSEISRLFRPEFVDQFVVARQFRTNGKLIFYEDGVLDLRNERDQGIFINEAQKAGAHRTKILKNTRWGKNLRRKEGNCKTDPLPAGVVFVPHPRQKPTDLTTGHFEYTHDATTDRLKGSVSTYTRR